MRYLLLIAALLFFSPNAEASIASNPKFQTEQVVIFTSMANGETQEFNITSNVIRDAFGGEEPSRGSVFVSGLSIDINNIRRNETSAEFDISCETGESKEAVEQHVVLNLDKEIIVSLFGQDISIGLKESSVRKLRY